MTQKTNDSLRWLHVAWVPLSLGLLLTACSNDEADHEQAQPAAETTDAPSEPSTPETPPGEGFLHDDDEDHGGFPYRDELTDEAHEEALIRAGEFVAAAAWHDDEWEWWDGVEPFLTETGINEFNSIDPYNIDYTEVTGPPELHEELAASLVTVDVPTDGPTMRVMLSHREVDWYVQSWEYAEEESEDE